GGGLLWKFARNAPAPATVAIAAGASATNAASSVVDDRKSIAVLPFANMSSDKDNAYFSDGVSEEILDVLARSPGLHVAAFTSSSAFKGKGMTVPAIAHQLNVRMVLEGSVRRAGDRVRVTAQLIDAKTGFQVWSQTYDRKLKDIFAIQDDIAKAIGNELEVKLAGTLPAGKNSVGTNNLKAYDLYLRGNALWHTRQEANIWQAVDLLNQAITTDTEFAQAYASLAMVYADVGDYSSRIPIAESLSRATDFAEQALALNPRLPEAYAALGIVAGNEFRRATAVKLLSRAIALQPSFANAYMARGRVLMANGDLAGAMASLDQALSLDPRSLIGAANKTLVLQAMGRLAEAKVACKQALAIQPTFVPCLGNTAIVDLELGDYPEAQSLFERQAVVQNPSARAQGRELVAALSGHADRHALALRYATFAVDSLVHQGSGNVIWGAEMPVVLMLLGEHQLALDYLERLAAFAGGSADDAVMMPALDPIRCQPRFVAIVKKLRTTDPYHNKVCAKKN
ncbi:MAG: tetratricopeptide repeat protein, partial [Rhodanobacteraceae bacterium]